MARPVVVGIIAVIVAGVLFAPSAGAQPPLIAGGLTALPSTSTGPNLASNADFETLNDGLPVGWSGGAGWATDQLVVHAGAASYRRTTGAPTSSQRLQLRAGTYFLSAWVKTEELGSGSTSGVRLTLDFRSGGINAWTSSAVISGTSDWQEYRVGPIVVETDRIADIRLENYNGPSGTAWFDDVRLEQVVSPSVDVFLLYPNYRGMLFDDQPQTIQLDVTVTPPGDDFGRHGVSAVLTDEATGELVAQHSVAAAAHLVVALDGGGMQPGRRYLATVSLVDLSTDPVTVVSTYPAYRLSRVAATARQSMNVSFDAKNRVLLQGVPRFVLGVYDAGIGYSTVPAYWENTLWSATGARRMNGLNINMYLNYHFGEAPNEPMAALMANLQQHGVMYLQTGNCYDRLPADPDFQINNPDPTYVQRFGAHAGSAGYYTIDECRAELQPGAFAQYLRLRELDPDSMTLASQFGDPELALWRDSADLLSTDPYPLFSTEPPGGYHLAQVADWTARTRAVVKNARPFMTVLQFFKFTSQGRFPTLSEMRHMAYMAIVEGARGLWWWSLGTNALRDVCPDWCPEKIAHMDNLKSVVNELAALEAALLADDVAGALVANSNIAAIRTKVKVVGGKGYIFAYNYTGIPQSVELTWHTAPGAVTVNTERRALVPAGASFTDTFAPYQAHVYVVHSGAVSPLTAAFTSPAANATVSGSVPVTVTATGGSSPGYVYTIAVDGNPISTGAGSTVTWNTTTVADGPHTLTVTVTDSAGETTSASQSVTVSNTPPALTLTFNGKTRDRVGQGNTFLTADGALDGVLTATLSGGRRTLTTLRLDSSGPGTWDTDGATAFWALGVASAVDGALLNDPSTMAVNFTVDNGASFVLVAADYANIEFAPGVTLTVRATFSDGTTATATTNVTAAPSPPPAQGVTLGIAYNGKTRDRVGQSNTALSPDGALDGVLTATLSGGGRTITALRLDSSGPGTWDTDGASASWALGAAAAADGALLNEPTTMAVNFSVADGGGFVVFASDYANIEFAPGATLTLRATFSDGTTATATTTATTAPPPPPASGVTLGVAYNGKTRDGVGQSNTALSPDGALDGVLTVTLTGGGRTITGLRLDSSGPGTWDTDGATAFWALGAAPAADGALLNDPSTMAVNFSVPDGGSFVVLASDYANIEFAPGATLTLRATFSDGTTATATTTATSAPPPPASGVTLGVTYSGKIRDRVGQGNTTLSPDGALDGTVTVTLTASGGRTLTGVRLESTGPGTWDTDGGSPYWALGVAATVDGPLTNDPGTVAVALAVPDGGSFILFASDYANIEFVAGAQLTVTASFSDGTTATAITTVP